jgi:hypothetical protein
VHLYQLSFGFICFKKQRLRGRQIRLPVGCQAAEIRLPGVSPDNVPSR